MRHTNVALLMVALLMGSLMNGPPLGPKEGAAIRELETVSGRDVGRGIGSLVDVARGGLAGAASSIASHPQPHVALLTGFFVPGAEPPAAETDGPVGAAQLAAGLAAAGVPVRLATDELCVDAVRAAMEAALGSLVRSVKVAIEVVPLAGRSQVAAMRSAWSAAQPPVSHAIAIERVGPAIDGVPRNMRGEDISAHTAPLHLLFQGGGHVSVGIGDGGNELGMGSLPHHLVARVIAHGDRIACGVPADHLLVCGVSNWGACALAAALAVLQPSWRAALLNALSPELGEEILAAAVTKGPCVDGVLGKQEASVDGLAASAHSAVQRKLLDVVRRYVDGSKERT